MIGIPLGYLGFHIVSGFPISNTVFLLTKQAINGMANALLARLVFAAYSQRRPIKDQYMPFHELVCNLLALFVICTALLIITVDSRDDFTETERRIRTGLSDTQQQIKSGLSGWLEERRLPVVHLAEMAAEIPAEKMQPYLEQIQASDANFWRVALIDEEGVSRAYAPSTVTLWNPAAERVLGWAATDIVGKPLPILTEHQHAEHRSLCERVRQGQTIEETVTKRKKNDGSLIDVSLAVAPLWDRQGNVSGIMGVMTDITERKRAEDGIKTALAEKETLLRELYHRTKNNMQIIRSMMVLQAAKRRNADIIAFVAEIEQKILTMALIHQKLYQSNDLSHIYLHEYLTELTSLLIQGYEGGSDRIKLNLSLAPVTVLIDTAMPCGLIVNELMSNAWRHAFPNGSSGEIRIGLSQTSRGEIEIRFSDNGRGTPKDFDFRTQSSLGLKTVIELVEHQLKGKISCTIGNGIAYTIRFSDNLYRNRI